MIVYKATNIKNNKIYIGKTSETLRGRKRGHKYEAKTPKGYFGYALRKYGIEGFKWDILYFAPNLKELNLKEIECIKLYNSTNNKVGYNITEGGTGGDTYTNNPRREEILKAMKIERNTPEAKLRVSKVHKGKKATKEQRVEMSIARTGSGNGMYGKNHTEEALKLMSENKKGKKQPIEAVRKTAEANTGKKRTQKQKANISISRCIYLYTVIFPDGWIYITNNIKKFCLENKDIFNISFSGILHAIRNTGHYKGWHFSRVKI